MLPATPYAAIPHKPTTARKQTFYLSVSSGLLLHKQLKIGCHEVYTPLNAETFAHKRRLHHYLRNVERPPAAVRISTEQSPDSLFYVFGLQAGLVFQVRHA
ncbi:DNA helicase [Prevotella sp. MGM1]|nr:DNA helicase [Prevotella sp. MGM1]